MNQYRKKPIVIEAFQMTEHRRWHNDEWPNWLHRAWNFEQDEEGAVFPAEKPALLCIHTLEGLHLVGPDDWIIQGVKGELYPCKSDIFEATYEPV